MFIAGSNYSYTYNEQVGRSKRIQYYLNTTAGVAGNLFSLATLATGEEVSDTDQATVLGAVYSQFARVGVDGRGYLKIGEQDKLAMRLFADAGNVWLQQSNSATGGDSFAITRVLNELAVGEEMVGCGGAAAETVAGGGASLGDEGAGVYGRWLAVGEHGAECGDRVSVLMFLQCFYRLKLVFIGIQNVRIIYPIPSILS